MNETVMRWRDFLPEFLPLPHPSWRNTAWLKRNPWFEAEFLPELRRRVHALIEAPLPRSGERKGPVAPATGG